MKIIGDINTANKFYINLNGGGIEWVPSLEIAKTYYNDPKIINWYKKDIYATNEDIVKGTDNKIYLKSQIPDELIYSKTDHLLQFKNQAEKYIQDVLQEKIEKDGFNSIEEVISWKDSQIIQFNQYALKFLKYRDTCYIYYLNLLENNIDILTKSNNLDKISEVYKFFIENFPKLPNKKYF